MSFKVWKSHWKSQLSDHVKKTVRVSFETREWLDYCESEDYIVCAVNSTGTMIAYSQSRTIVGKWMTESDKESAGVDYGWIAIHQ